MIGLPSTVRFRVAAIATLAVVVVLVATSVAVVTLQRQVLTDSLDEMISGRVDELAAAITAGENPPLTNLGADDTVAQIVTLDGQVLAASPPIADEPPIGPSIDAGTTRSNRGPAGLADDDMRVLSRVVTAPGGPVVVHLAATTDDIDESVAALRRSLAVAVPIVAAVLAALTWLLVGRTLRPVEQIRSGAASIGGDLERRVPVPQGDDEITRLARTMNEMLDRLADASERQRRFVADASHELRSPLTRMRAELEVDITHPHTADPTATHQSVLDEVVGLQQLVDDLLLLAHSAELARQTGHRTDRVDVAAVARRVAERTPADGVALDVTADRSATATGNAGELARAIGNLVDNATRHARSTVRIDVAQRDGDVTVAVSDDGPGIPAADRERVFERFARVDDARSPAHGGAGLGLSITRDIVERHRGTVAVDPDHAGGTRVTIRLPATT